MKGLEIDPEERWATAAQMVAAFRRIEERLVQETRSLLVRRKKSQGKSLPKTVSSDTPKSSATKSSPKLKATSKPKDAEALGAKKKSKPPTAANSTPVDVAAESMDDDEDILSLDPPEKSVDNLQKQAPDVPEMPLTEPAEETGLTED